MAIEIVDFPIENGGSFYSYVELPEGIHNETYPRTEFRSRYLHVANEKSRYIRSSQCIPITKMQNCGTPLKLHIIIHP